MSFLSSAGRSRKPASFFFFGTDRALSRASVVCVSLSGFDGTHGVAAKVFGSRFSVIGPRCPGGMLTVRWTVRPVGLGTSSASECDESDMPTASSSDGSDRPTGEGDRRRFFNGATGITSSMTSASESLSSSLIAMAESSNGDLRCCVRHLRTALPLALPSMAKIGGPSSERGGLLSLLRFCLLVVRGIVAGRICSGPSLVRCGSGSGGGAES